MLSLLNHSRRLLPSSLPSTRLRLPLKTWTRSYQVDTTTTTTTTTNDKKTVIHDAIIIGGGPTGLLLSNLLSSHNIHSHLLFDKRPVTELLQHPQAHFINVRSMEILKAELPYVYEAVVREMPDVGEWDGFQFGGSVFSQVEKDDDGGQLCSDDYLGGGRRLGRVSHPVREPLRVGQRGDAILAGGIDNPTMTNDDAPPVSSCRPAHLAQNKFVALLMQEARRHYHLDDQDEISDAGNNKTSNHHNLRYGEEVVRISEHSSSSNSFNNTGNHPPPLITIHTSQGQSYHTRYLLAADGVNSFTRKKFGIPMMGEDSMQNLINVHFRTNGTLSELLMRRSSSSPNDHNQAMLHFVYNSKLVGAFVCHDGNKGEWVLQIPFFPPFQTMENDFDAGKVRDMIWAGLVGDVLHPENNTRKTEDDTNFNFEILSIRPWTMSSLVAQRYLNESKNMVLVGDAAHAFPPAGGFGMNTGLQDAHNIAWRLALLLNREKRNGDFHPTLEHGKNTPTPSDEIIDPSSSSSSRPAPTTSFSNAILSKYDQERKPIATQNAALSVRNYQRTLRIAKACYLDAQHPQLLISMLNSLPMNMLPLETRQDMFRRLVSVAMMPLGSLISSPKSGGMQGGRHSFHADHIEKNVMSILKSGGSLPLVFPRYELGFSYNPNSNDATSERSDAAAANTDEIGGDTAGYFPRLKVGHRMPHVLVEVLAFSSAAGKDGDEGVAVLETLDHCRTASNNDLAHANTDDGIIHISLSDISSQLRRAHSCPSPVFTLIAFGPALTSSLTLIGEAVDRVMKKWNVPLMLVTVLPARPNDVDEHQNKVGSSTDDISRDGRESKGFNVLYTVDTQHSLLQLLHDVEPALAHNTMEQTQQKQNDSNASENDADDAVNALIMVRPDGHIANISRFDEREGVEKMMSKQIEQVMEQGFQNALGGEILLED